MMVTVIPPPCDICPEPAAVIRPATASRELAVYCRADANRYLGWGDTFRDIEEADYRAGGDS